MKYFWICLFTFLTFLVVAAAIFRPDTLDGILAYTGLYLAAVGWAFVSLAFLLPIGFAVGGLAVLYVYVKKNHNEWLRPRDGSYPLQRLDPNKPTVIYDPNQQVGSAAVWHPQYGWLEMDGGAGWDRQLAVAAQRALVARAQAANVGDNAIVKSASYMKDAMGGGGSFFKAIRPTIADQRAVERGPKGWGDELQGEKIPPPPVSSAPAVLPPRLTLQQAVREATRDKIVFGSQLETGDRAVWDLTETPHMRVHGGTQKGKTSAVITVVAGALAQTNQVIVLDPRGFKDWHIAGDYAELVDVRKMDVFVAALANVHEEYLRRDKLLAENNAQNISALRGAVRPPRLIVIVEELGAQRFRAKEAGLLEQVDYYMSVLTSEAAASGVHIVAVDQRPSNYHAFVKANLGAVVVFGLPDDGAGKAAGYARAHKLSRYEFAFEGIVYVSVNAVPDFDAIVRASSPIHYPPVLSVRSERSVDRRSTVRAVRSRGRCVSGRLTPNDRTGGE